MSKIEITPVRSESELMEFIRLPWEVYRGNPHWVPPLISERRTFLNRERNPFFEHARAEYFIARRDGRTVGTIAAFTNDLYNEVNQKNIGWFGFFEVLDDPEAAAALLESAEGWARRAGHERIYGPAQFSSNDEWALLVDGFDDPPRVLMTYNPRRYLGYMDASGFTKAMDMWAYSGSLEAFGGEQNLPEKLLRVGEKVLARGQLKLRRADMKKFDREVEHVKNIYNKAWMQNWGYVPMTDAEIERLAEQLRQFVDPDLVLFVEHEGEVVGFGLSLPDLNQPLRLAYPRPGEPEPWTLAKLFWHWKVGRRAEWVRIMAIGALPEYQGRGVTALIFSQMARNALRKGFKYAEMSWILESNPKSFLNVEHLGGKIYKTYRIYEKRLAASA